MGGALQFSPGPPWRKGIPSLELLGPYRLPLQCESRSHSLLPYSFASTPVQPWPTAFLWPSLSHRNNFVCKMPVMKLASMW